jgi:hypothetical protein
MWRSRRTARDQGGSLVVESAIIFPLLFLLVFGALEYGLLFKDDLTGSNAVRTGGRTLSASTSKFADQAALQALRPAAAGFQGGLEHVSRVVVYIATCANPASYTSATTSRCGSAPPIGRLEEMGDGTSPCIPKSQTVGIDGYCNIYTAEHLTSAFVNDPANWGCDTSGTWTRDAYWCPEQRVALQSVGTDYVGLRIEYEHDWVTGLFGTTREMSDDVIFRLEPQGF